MAEGKSYAQIEPSFFFHDERFNRLCTQHQMIYLAYWMLAREHQREVLLGFTDVAFVAKSKNISKYFANIFKPCLINVQKFHPKPLLSFSDAGYVKVHGVRAKHRKLRNWHDDDDKALTEKYFGIGKRGKEREERKDDVELQAAELQALMDRITVAKQSPINWTSPSEKAFWKFWNESYKETWELNYPRGKWDKKTIKDLLSSTAPELLMAYAYWFLQNEKQDAYQVKRTGWTVETFAQVLPQLAHRAEGKTWLDAKKVVAKFRKANPSLFQSV